MKTPRFISIIACGLLVLPVSISSLHAQASMATVDRVEKREQALKLAAEVLKARENPAAKLPADLVNPFRPAGFGQEKAVPNSEVSSVVVPPKSTDHDVLQSIAAKIKPSGAAIIGGQPLLLLSQKKVKVGDVLTINFDGADYLIEVTRITGNAFTIRLNSEELTRPIK